MSNTNDAAPVSRRFLNRDETCEELRISRAFYHVLVRRDVIRPLYIGRKPIIPTAQIPEILARLNPEAEAA